MENPQNSNNANQREVFDADVNIAASDGVGNLSLASLSVSVSESDPDSPPLSPQRAEEEERWIDNDTNAVVAASADNGRGECGAVAKSNVVANADANIGNNCTTRTPPRHDTIHKNYPYSSMSPRVPQSYIIGRTQSSPSIIDASPKVKKNDVSQKHYQGMFSLSPKPRPGSVSTTRVQNHNNHTSQLTPVARNTARPFSQNNTDSAHAYAKDRANKLHKDTKLQYLSVPETNSLHNKSSSSSPSKALLAQSRNMGEGSSRMIRPRRSTVTGTFVSNESNENRPISPPSWLSHRATSLTSSDAATSTNNSHNIAPIPSSGSSPHSSSSSPSSMKENASADQQSYQNRFPSPLNARVKLDRNHYSFPFQYPHQHHNQSSPESIFSSNTPQPRSPPNECHTGEGSLYPDGAGVSTGIDNNKQESLEEFLIVKPYQPSRDSSLASFGVVPDELDDIFLPLRRHRTSKSKSNKLRRDSGRGGDSEDDDADDSFSHVSDSQSSTSFTSFPSIRLGVRIHSSTQDSVTTAEGGVEGSSTFDEEDSLVFQHHDGTLFIGSGGSVGEKKKKNHGRCLSSKEEKQVYEWLHALEVDKDNNEYVAEAASSKFLTGKMNAMDYNTSGGRFISPSEFRSRADHAKDEEQKLDGNDDDNNVDMKEKKDSSVRSVKSSSNKIVMGRNICAFDRSRPSSNVKNNAKGKSSSFKVSGLYR